ncbi:MAG TPA: aminoacyl-tRNA hydrolase [Salinivirgaceae bacterium]|nr:aminoacyl-tRNA hydrolase [Salinivirgaceae bacterium]HQA75793.1 aminoacyl-tRNA hydrolase [Salinivirgaceae bacterium]
MKFLIIGLGNIGKEYQNTRHNVGFEVADATALKFKATFQSARYGDISTFKIKGRHVILLKPSTYMNLSGNAVRYWMRKEDISIENILVITDDVALPIGTIRLRMKGSDAGHNGLKHIIETLGTDNFSRLRLGIGNDYPKGFQVDYVLSKWSQEEYEIIAPRFDVCVNAIENFVLMGIQHTMNNFNNK